MGKKLLTTSELNLEGKFIGFVGDAGKFKYLQLAIAAGDIQVKLPKELRAYLSATLVPGEQIRVDGMSELNPHTGEIKFKAYRVKPTGVCPMSNLAPQTKAKIMVCQKSGCIKRGGKGLLSELEKTLCDRGLLDKVTIEHTGCQKRCSSAPNCIVRIGKKQYKKIHPDAIASLLENHFT